MADVARTSNNARVLVWVRGDYATPQFVAKYPPGEGWTDSAIALEGVGPTQCAAILDLETQLDAL